MGDRAIVHTGAVPQDTDILNTNLYAYIALSKLASGILGTTTQLNGLACTQTGTPSMSVQIGAGEIYQLDAIDTSAYGSLPTNSNQILKQGINLDAVITTAMTAPVTVGQSINYLIEFQLQEVDSGSVVLPYYNSVNPSQTFNGPNNSSQPSYTVRQDKIAYQIKAGTPAATGSQTTPSPDSGWVGGWVVTVAYGATSILNSAIVVYSSAPFMVSNNLHPIIQSNSYLYAADTSGSANTVTASLNPALTAYTTGMTVFIKIANTNTGASTINLNALGAKSIKLMNGAALTGGELFIGQIAEFNYDGTNFQLQNPVGTQLALQGNSYLYAADTSGVTNTITAALTPPLTAYTTGMTVFIKILHTNTGACTINLNALGSKSVKLMSGAALTGGELLLGQIAEFNYDGTNFQLQNPANTTVGGFNSYNIIILTGSGTYTPTTGMVQIWVRMTGGGGGSGAITNAGGYAVSQGGSAGNYQEFWMTAAQVGASKTYACGAGGTAGTAGGAGGAGGNTTFANWTAAAGLGGIGQVGGAGNTISAYPAANALNTNGTGTLVQNILGSFASIGFSLPTPLLGASSIGGNSWMSGYNQDGVGMTGNYYIAAANVAGIAATNGYGNGATGAIALNSAAAQNGAVGGAGLIILVEFLST